MCADSSIYVNPAAWFANARKCSMPNCCAAIGRRFTIYGQTSMADVFVSYANADRNSARALAEALEHYGWSVWWDREIPIGRTWDEVIEEEIARARSVLVLWSASS